MRTSIRRERLPLNTVIRPASDVTGPSQPAGEGGTRPGVASRLPQLPRLDPRLIVGTIAATLVLGAAVITADNAANRVRESAVSEARRSAEIVMRSSVDLVLTDEAMHAPGSPAGQTINDMLERVVYDGGLLRVKVWSPEGEVLFSDLPALRGQVFPIEHDLEEALEGEVEAEFASGDELGGENASEQGTAEYLLEMYLPIVHGDGNVVGAYEIYLDAGPIETVVAETRRDVFLTALAVAAALLLLLAGAFTTTSRRLAAQNRRLSDLAGDLRGREARFRALVQNASDAVAVLDPAGTIGYESVTVQRVLGYAPEDRAGRSFLESAHDEDRLAAVAALTDVAETDGAARTFDLRMRHADGSWRAIECVARNLIHEPAVGGVVVNYRDITERRSLEEQLTHQAFHDPLTGLANRALFGDRVAHAVERRRRDGRPIIVLFADLDDFKTINDSLGHDSGDRVLVEVAERLRLAIRPGDTVARLGGDEFAVLLEDVTDQGDGPMVAQRLLAALEPPFTAGNAEVVLSASVGIAVSADRREGAEALLRDADVAMYTAKGRRRGGYAVYEPAMHAAAVARLELERDLRRAIEREEFVLEYQPIVALDDGRITGFEALVRWRRPGVGLEPPGAFIPTAEVTGLIVPIGAWVLREACLQAARWQATLGPHGAPTMSVNLSAREIADPALVERVATTLAETGVEPGRLVLEITETSMLEDADDTLATLHALRRLGVRLAIDDFGTGYSSLSYLRRLPIDILKLDRSLVSSTDGGTRDVALVDAVVRLGRELGLETIVEGVEEPTQRSRLVELGCELGQGFLFARPMDAASATSLLGPGPATDGADSDGGQDSAVA